MVNRSYKSLTTIPALFKKIYYSNCFFNFNKTMAYQGVKPVLDFSVKVIDTDVILNSGHKMPVLGFGTYTIRGNYNVLYTALDTALKAGYRSIDTATVYENEEDIGKALKELLPKYNLKREDIFITSKLSPSDQGKDKVKAAVNLSLKKLGLDYLDLYLIHWPGVSKLSNDSQDNSKLRGESWSGLVELVKEGKLRSAGVSNYLPRHIKQLLKESNVPPAVNQVEYHPHWQQDAELFELSAQTGTLIQSYSTLGGNRSKELITDPVVTSLAAKLNVQPAQVLLRWALQHGTGIIPKSQTPERIITNSQLDFLLSEDAMNTLDNIGKTTKYAWNPEVIIH